MDRVPRPVIGWVADRCLRVSFGDGAGDEEHAAVRAATDVLQAAALPALLDLTPAYASVLLTFDPARLDAEACERRVRAALADDLTGRLARQAATREVVLPTCYGGACGPDLEEVARLHATSAEEVVRRHSQAEYVVRFLGFSPGFPYLAGLPASLATPRLARPRRRVPAGSVAVAGAQAGVYPQATPGGWRLLGTTPLTLFDAQRPARAGGPALLGIGDRVRFVPIPHAEHAQRAEQALRAAGRD